MIASLSAIALLVLLVALCAVLGTAAVAKLGPWTSRLERAVFAVPVGMGIAAYLLFTAGMLGQANRPAFAGVLLVALAAAAVFLRGNLLAFWRGKKKPSEPRDLLGLSVGVVLAAVGLMTLVGALAPPGSLEWDALSYHLAGPKTYLRAGRTFYIPYDHHTNFPFLLQMLYLLMLSLGSVGGAKLCHWLCGALLVASVYTFSVRHGGGNGRRVGFLATVLLATTPIVLWEATVAYVDLATALFTWLSVYALCNAAQSVQEEEGKSRTSIPWLIVSAVLMGFALGTKYTVLGFWGMLLVGILGWNFVTTHRWAKETAPHAALWAVISLAIAAPWYLKTLVYTGNPVYPFAYSVFGGRYWNAENAAGYAADQAKFGLGKTPVQMLLGPWQATMEQSLLSPSQPFVFTEYISLGYGLSPVFVALVLASPFILARGRRFSPTTLYLLLFGGGVYVFWFFLMQQTRYLIPALPALAVVCAEILVLLWNERQGVARWAGAALVAFAALNGLYLTAAQIAAPNLPVALGAEPRDTVRGLLPAERFINENTPPNAKVALFDETRGFYLDRDYAWATPNHAYGFFSWDAYQSADDWLQDFKKRGYTVLLTGARDPNAPDDGQKWRPLLRDATAGDKVTLLYENRGVKVYQIK